MDEGTTLYCGNNCNHTGPHRYRPALAARSEPLTNEQWDRVRMEPDPVAALARSVDVERLQQLAGSVDAARTELWRVRQDIALLLAATSAADSRGLDVEYVMDAEHRYCVQVEGEWALGHEVERHRAQAEFIIARLTDPEPAP